MDSDTTFLASLFQRFTTLSVMKFFLISNLNLSRCNLRPCAFNNAFPSLGTFVTLPGVSCWWDGASPWQDLCSCCAGMSAVLGRRCFSMVMKGVQDARSSCVCLSCASSSWSHLSVQAHEDLLSSKLQKPKGLQLSFPLLVSPSQQYIFENCTLTIFTYISASLKPTFALPGFRSQLPVAWQKRSSKRQGLSKVKSRMDALPSSQ